MLKVSASLDSRNVAAASTGERRAANDSRHGLAYDDAYGTTEERPFHRLTAVEAAELAARQPSVSPWQVVGVQALLGALLGAAAWWLSGSRGVGISAVYGALVVVVPSALMARGATSPLGRISPVSSALSVLFWAGVKLAVTVLMLALASKVVQPLSWPALLVAMVACLQVYWVALLWQGRPKR